MSSITVVLQRKIIITIGKSVDIRDRQKQTVAGLDSTVWVPFV